MPDIHTNNLKVKGNIILGPNSTINYGKIDMDGDFVTSDELPENLSDLINDMDFINSNDAVLITKETITAPYIQAMNLVVGQGGITLDPNATITWSQISDPDNASISWKQVTGTGSVATIYDIPTDSQITTISQNAIKTAEISANQITAGTINAQKVKLTGNLYRSPTESFGDANFLIGVNTNSRLQIGSASSSPGYTDSVLYSNGNLYFVTNGSSVEERAIVIESNKFITIDSLSSSTKDSDSDTGTHRLIVAGKDGKLHASSATLSSIADGNLKVTAVFG